MLESEQATKIAKPLDELAELRHLLLGVAADSQADELKELRELLLAQPQTELSELRSLLFGPEQAALKELKQRVEDAKVRTKDISEVLPDAIIVRLSQDSRLTKALTPVVEEAFSTSVKQNPQPIINAVSPIIGPAIRKAITQAFSQMIQSLNQTLEYSISVKGIKWRVEALRTGRSFAEVVLSHTLLYRVEQVFLIHKDNGILLQHASAPNIVAQDADIISGMLTAIQDFAKDSFSIKQGEGLETFQIGELTVWIEQGPQAVLAAVIRGTAPQALRSLFQDALEQIHLAQNRALLEFNGDTTPFEASHRELENCLLMQVGRQEVQKSSQPSPLLVVAALLVLIIGGSSFFYVREQLRWSQYLRLLAAEPGIVLISSSSGWHQHSLVGLRDPLAKDPQQILATQTALDTKYITTRWELYHSGDPKIVLQRAQQILQPPPTIRLQFDNGILSAHGSAELAWLKEAQKMALAIAGVVEFRANELMVQRFSYLKAQLEHYNLTFIKGRDELNTENIGEVTTIANWIKELVVLANQQDHPLHIVIIGLADASGTAEINDKLRINRATNVRNSLINQGIAEKYLTIETNQDNTGFQVVFKVVS